MKQQSHDTLSEAIADLDAALPEALLVKGGRELYMMNGGHAAPADPELLSEKNELALQALRALKKLAADDQPRTKSDGAEE